MANKKVIYADVRFQFRHDTAANWAAINPILLAGEHGVVIDGTESEREKIGDGVTPWNELGWWKGPKGDKGEVGPQGIQGEKGDKGNTGSRGTGILKVATSPTYTSSSNYPYRIQATKVLEESGFTAIVGDIIEFKYYHYPVVRLTDEFVYLGEQTSIRGEQGASGDDYVLTEEDMQKIAGRVNLPVDQTYNSESENAQSGKAVAEGINKQVALVYNAFGDITAANTNANIKIDGVINSLGLFYNELKIQVEGEYIEDQNRTCGYWTDENGEDRLIQMAVGLNRVCYIPVIAGDIIFIDELTGLVNNGNGSAPFKSCIWYLTDGINIPATEDAESSTILLKGQTAGQRYLSIKDTYIVVPEGATYFVYNYTLDSVEDIKIIPANSISSNKKISELEEQVGDIETALDNIIAIQNSLIGGDA